MKNIKQRGSTNKPNQCRELVKVEKKNDIIREPKTDGYYLDLCKNNLSTFPVSYLDNQRLGLLYLEGNSLTELAEEIFVCFPNLQWLDVRNNQIEDIPTTIKFHPRLETFLVQNNRIKSLPPEVGTVANLKNMQILPNPLTYPPMEIVVKGTSAVVNFLHDEFKKDNPEYLKYVLKQELMKQMEEELNKPAPVPKPTKTDLLNKQLRNLKYCIPFEKNKSEYLKRLNEVSFDVCSPLKVKKYLNPHDKLRLRNRLSMEENNDHLLEDYNEGSTTKGAVERGRLILPMKDAPFVGKAFSNKRRSKINTIISKLLHSLNEAKSKDRTIIIDEILDLRRNIVNQQKFKYEYRYRSRLSYLKKAYMKPEKPFGTYAEYDTMPNRRQLQLLKQNSIKKSRYVRRRVIRNKVDINEQIKELLKSLDKISFDRPRESADDNTEKAKKKVTTDISKIAEIQKALKRLQISNHNAV